MYSSQRLKIFPKLLPMPTNVKMTAAKEYFYTLENNVLTEDQRNFYEEYGFIVIPKLVDDEILDECRQRFVDICNGIVDKGQITFMKEKSLMNSEVKGEFLCNKIQDIIWDDIFTKYFLHPKILQYVKCFTGPDITAINSMVINKPPDSAKHTSVHPLHQDLFYFTFRPAERIVASWTALEKTTVDNGCLFVIPGTHKGSLQPHDYPQPGLNFGFHGIKGFDLVPRVNLEMEKGDTVFFHPLLMHGSGPNITKGFRKAISCHYASNNCYFIDIEDITHKIIADEVVTAYKNKGIYLDYQEFLKLRQRVIKGKPGIFNKL